MTATILQFPYDDTVVWRKMLAEGIFYIPGPQFVPPPPDVLRMEETLADVIGTINFPQKFRSQADLGAKLGIFSTRLTWNHLAGYLNTTVTPSQQVAKYDTFDLSLGVDVLSRVRLSFDVRNLLNEDPPFVDTTRGYDAQSANPIPRMFSLSAAVKF